MELTSNGLAMNTQLTELFKTLEIPDLSHRLLEETETIDSSNEEFSQIVDAPTCCLLTCHSHSIRADIVVAKDGSGKFKSIYSALGSIPAKNNNTIIIIIIKDGIGSATFDPINADECIGGNRNGSVGHRNEPKLIPDECLENSLRIFSIVYSYME
nr:pectinesterase-like [Ipomoea batatas]